MLLAIALLINNVILFLLETSVYQFCHSVVMLLDGYYHLCQAILCAVRIVSQSLQFTYTSRQTYGLARVGVVGELVAFVSFCSLSISVFLESVKHLIDAIADRSEHAKDNHTAPNAHHSLVDRPYYILAVGIYATVSNLILAMMMLYIIVKGTLQLRKQLEQRRPSLKQPLPEKLVSKSLLITDTLPTHHAYLHIFNMLLGPVVILLCGVILIVLSGREHIRGVYSRFVDPTICCFLFLFYLFIIFIPAKGVVRLVLQANPCNLKLDQIEKLLCDSVSGVIGIHELHIWRLTPQRTLATVHVVFNTTEDIHTKYGDISYIFQTLHIDHVTIQPEFSLPSDQIEKLGCHYRCAPGSTECGPLQCCETSPL